MDTYHHGDLRAAVLARALEILEEQGASALSLRSLANDLGVSHTAPRHHFGDLRGVLTAIATEGFEELARRLVAKRESGASFSEIGTEYVAFALDHRASFGVMFDPTLVHSDDEALRSAQASASAELTGGVEVLSTVRSIEDSAAAVLAGWSLVHGLAVLALSGNLAESGLGSLVAGGDILTIAGRATSMLYGSPS